MISDVKLSEIFIGKADGSDESQIDDFSNLFYRGNNKYDELANSSNKFILTGRKGTGKTILAKYHEMIQNNKGIFSKTVTKDDIILKKLVEMGSAKLTREEQRNFIKYAILTEIGELIIQNEAKCKKNLCSCKDKKLRKELKHHLRELKNVLNFRYRSFDNFVQSSLEQSAATEEELEGSLSSTLSLARSLRRASQSKKMLYTKSNYLTLINSLTDKIALLTTYNPITLIFDDLDEYDSSLNEDNINFLVDFLNITKKINQNVLKKDKKNNRIIVLIRQDILSTLNSNSHNISKLLQDSTIYLNWLIKMEGKPSDNPLIDLVITKIQRSNQRLWEYKKEEIFKMFFPDKIMKKPTLTYLYENSFGRPRDIVNYLEIIRQEFPDKTSFEASCFTAMEMRYSTRFLEELQNELYIHYPREFINECIKVFDLLHRVTFQKEHVEQVLTEYGNQLTHLKDASEFIGCMYKFGAIGMRIKVDIVSKKNKSKQTGYKCYWGYREDGRVNPDYNAEFIIHYGLKKSLIG
ncbi:hypothetical protein H0486_00875 [Lachnospiraceae bacterium MD1]|jgi:hypothetical protein|uniref:FunZ protein n=1 Tax=Variimorphobacter saccharofermentans TaxID=2755051 RepID=A0A839JW09_9FIRM|nr:hypothetical protein [Variimorphobacter saccharofermentans]MBB2181447.1 hypothetical protein [Variimorphobacter saccharofermentans]